jgi:hypothetical protein
MLRASHTTVNNNIKSHKRWHMMVHLCTASCSLSIERCILLLQYEIWPSNLLAMHSHAGKGGCTDALTPFVVDVNHGKLPFNDNARQGLSKEASRSYARFK